MKPVPPVTKIVFFIVVAVIGLSERKNTQKIALRKAKSLFYSKFRVDADEPGYDDRDKAKRKDQNEEVQVTDMLL